MTTFRSRDMGIIVHFRRTGLLRPRAGASHATLVILLTVAAALDLQAQGRVRIPAPSAAQCTAALDTISHGPLTATAEQSRAIVLVGQCNAERDTALAVAWRRRQAEPASADMEWVFSARLAGAAMRRAATDIATSPSASVAARALSVGALMRYLSPQADTRPAAIQGGAVGSLCLPRYIGDYDAPERDTTQLDPSFAEQIRALAFQLERSGTVATEVRSAANCTANAWRQLYGYQPSAMATSDVSQVTVVPVCGTLFRVRNPTPQAITLLVSIGSDPQRRFLHLEPKPQNASFSETMIDSKVPGANLTLREGDMIVASATPASGACTVPPSSM